jgi:hypothetical protein
MGFESSGTQRILTGTADLDDRVRMLSDGVGLPLGQCHACQGVLQKVCRRQVGRVPLQFRQNDDLGQLKHKSTTS